MLALLVKIGLPILPLARMINVGADCLSGVLIFLMLRRFKVGVAMLAALFYALFPRVIVWSISGMETSLYVLFIGSNQIFDISPLAGLSNLILLNLVGNQIIDISPLVANVGLSTGDYVFLNNNPLSCSPSCDQHVPQLESRGVNVFKDCGVCP